MSRNCRSLSHALKRDSRADTVMQSNLKTQIRSNRPCSAAGFCQITSDTSSAELMSSIPSVNGSGISRTMLSTIAYRENGTLQCQRRSKVSGGRGLVQSFDSGPPSISNPPKFETFLHTTVDRFGHSASFNANTTVESVRVENRRFQLI